MNAGYKGVVHKHQGYVNCPRNPFKLKSWQDTLQELELSFNNWIMIGKRDRESGLEDVNRIMKTSYPGNYTVIEAYDSKRGVFGFKLMFDDPKEETFWLLKWS